MLWQTHSRRVCRGLAAVVRSHRGFWTWICVTVWRQPELYLLQFVCMHISFKLYFLLLFVVCVFVGAAAAATAADILFSFSSSLAFDLCFIVIVLFIIRFTHSCVLMDFKIVWALFFRCNVLLLITRIQTTPTKYIYFYFRSNNSNALFILNTFFGFFHLLRARGLHRTVLCGVWWRRQFYFSPLFTCTTPAPRTIFQNGQKRAENTKLCAYWRVGTATHPTMSICWQLIFINGMHIARCDQLINSVEPKFFGIIFSVHLRRSRQNGTNQMFHDPMQLWMILLHHPANDTHTHTDKKSSESSRVNARI